MPIIDEVKWWNWGKKNKDPYGKCCVDVAREVMEMLDKPEYKDFDPSDIINKADANINAGGITGFMAGCVAQIVSACHSRGEEFRKKWNIKYQLQTEGEEANKGKGVLNPALLNINMKEE